MSTGITRTVIHTIPLTASRDGQNHWKIVLYEEGDNVNLDLHFGNNERPAHFAVIPRSKFIELVSDN